MRVKIAAPPERKHGVWASVGGLFFVNIEQIVHSMLINEHGAVRLTSTHQAILQEARRTCLW